MSFLAIEKGTLKSFNFDNAIDNFAAQNNVKVHHPGLKNFRSYLDSAVLYYFILVVYKLLQPQIFKHLPMK